MNAPTFFATAMAAYLVGSIPTGFLVGRAKGIDLRAVGSGNIGATNALRALGTPAGVFVLLVDALKGLIACTFVPRLAQEWLGAAEGGSAQWLGVVAGVCAVLGHNYTCWLGFKGGKGIATSAGVVIALMPWAFLTSLAVFLLTLLVSRFVSLGSVLGAVVLPFATWWWHQDWVLVAFAAVLGALAVARHRTNLQRLFQGTEPRLGRKPTPAHPGSP